MDAYRWYTISDVIFVSYPPFKPHHTTFQQSILSVESKFGKFKLNKFRWNEQISQKPETKFNLSILTLKYLDLRSIRKAWHDIHWYTRNLTWKFISESRVNSMFVPLGRNILHLRINWNCQRETPFNCEHFNSISWRDLMVAICR